MKLLKNWRFMLVSAILVIILAAIYVPKALGNTKTSVVTGTYSNSAEDGCDGFKLKNGDTVDTFCFWAKPEDQTVYDGSIKVGDKVEYGTQSGKRFIRLKR